MGKIKYMSASNWGGGRSTEIDVAIVDSLMGDVLSDEPGRKMSFHIRSIHIYI